MKKVSLACLLVLTGCKVGPQYVPPEMEISDEWTAPAVADRDAPEIEWWKSFNDPLLEKYIELAACYNPDINSALANIFEARANRRIAASALYPKIDLNTNYRRNHYSSNIFFQPPSPTEDTPQLFPIFQINQEYYNIGFDALWELDLFGKIHSQVDAADARLSSAMEVRNDIIITVFGEVASNYMTIRGTQTLIDLTEQDIELLSRKMEMVKGRNVKGVASDIDLLTIEEELENRKATLPDLYSTLYQSIYQLSVLVGVLPETLLDEILVKRPLPLIPEKVTVGFRSDLLRRRPDIRGAERDLAGATADVRVAVASLFPAIRIGGNISQQSLHFGNLFNGSSNAWSTRADALTPVYHGGQLMANVDFMDSERWRRFYIYQKTVLNAVAEAETALTRFTGKYESNRQLDKSYSLNTQSTALRKELYDQGVINQMTYIDSQRGLIASKTNLVKNQTDTLISLVSLYKSLGGCFE